MNLSVLKRSDAFIERVLSSATHVAMYKLVEHNNQGDTWERCDVEGALFIVERNNDQLKDKEGRFRLVIVNRKSPQNYWDDIVVGNKDVELNNPDDYVSKFQRCDRWYLVLSSGRVNQSVSVDEANHVWSVPATTTTTLKWFETPIETNGFE